MSACERCGAPDVGGVQGIYKAWADHHAWARRFLDHHLSEA